MLGNLWGSSDAGSGPWILISLCALVVPARRPKTPFPSGNESSCSWAQLDLAREGHSSSPRGGAPAPRASTASLPTRLARSAVWLEPSRAGLGDHSADLDDPLGRATATRKRPSHTPDHGRQRQQGSLGTLASRSTLSSAEPRQSALDQRGGCSSSWSTCGRSPLPRALSLLRHTKSQRSRGMLSDASCGSSRTTRSRAIVLRRLSCACAAQGRRRSRRRRTR
jgi:hypothetical protein